MVMAVRAWLKVRHQPHGRARDFSEGKVVEGEKAAGGSGEALLPPYEKPPRRARRSAIWRIFLPCRLVAVLTTHPQGGGRAVLGCFRA